MPKWQTPSVNTRVILQHQEASIWRHVMFWRPRHCNQTRVGQCNLKAHLHLVTRQPTGLCDCGYGRQWGAIPLYVSFMQPNGQFRDLDAVQLNHTLLTLNKTCAVPASFLFCRVHWHLHAFVNLWLVLQFFIPIKFRLVV